ncbi:MAG: O-antigen ligase family protein, partial [Planctomycetaceae bacterium]|nr:O-antigen ligase family protein [Planctomycetaceae bacterium]
MATILVVLARCMLLLTLIAAPWAIGGADLPEQQWLFAGTLAAGVLAWLGVVSGGTARFSPAASAILLLVAALIAIGAAQLAPHPHYPEFRNAPLTGPLHVLDGDDTPATARSLYPAATRLQMGRLAIALCAFLGGAWLFRERNARYGLWALLALNGIAVVAFGLVQRSSWNGQLYWSIPLELGGQPFAAFVNRNNAAEYLSLCLAGALGLWASRRARPASASSSNRASPPPRSAIGVWERVPATTWSIMFLFLFGGVLATLSRGGALSAVAAVLLVGVWSAAGGRVRTLLLPLLGIVIAAGIWISVSQQGGALRDRLGSLGRTAASDGRLNHWNDMRGAIRDFPRLGTGLGTYRYANRPYENRRSESWFESADNQYLELIADGGLGAGAVALLLLAAGAGLAIAWRRADCPGEAMACGYALIAIGLQSVTDC